MNGEKTQINSSIEPGKTGPLISAIVVVWESCDNLKQTLGALRRQTLVKDLEVIFILPGDIEFTFNREELSVFNSWKIVRVDKIGSIAEGFVPGIKAARSGIVALTEDHSFPDEKWAELFVKDHKNQEIAVVGPAMKNANPVNPISWSDFFMAYGCWSMPEEIGDVKQIPGHNSSYKREVLISLGERFPQLMHSESVLHRALRGRGYKLYLESGTCTAHQNFYTWKVFIAARFYSGREFSGTWAIEWPWYKKAAYAVASPGIPFLRLYRTRKHIVRNKGNRYFLRLFPCVMAGFLVEGLGNFLGFIAGQGSASRKIAKYEFNRIIHK